MKLTPDDIKLMSPDPILSDIMPGYIERRKKDISDLNKAFTENDFLRIKSICHQVRGNASTFGFNGLQQVATEIENALDEKNYSEVQNKILLLDNFRNWLSVSH